MDRRSFSQFSTQRLHFESDTPRAKAVKELLKLPAETTVVYYSPWGTINGGAENTPDIEVAFYYCIQEGKRILMCIGGSMLCQMGHNCFGYPRIAKDWQEFYEKHGIKRPTEHRLARQKVFIPSLEHASIYMLEMIFAYCGRPLNIA